MKEKFGNILWFLGMFGIVVMVWRLEMEYEELWEKLGKGGVWFGGVIVVWVLMY